MKPRPIVKKAHWNPIEDQTQLKKVIDYWRKTEDNGQLNIDEGQTKNDRQWWKRAQAGPDDLLKDDGRISIS